MKAKILLLDMNADFSEKAINLYLKHKGLDPKDNQDLIDKLRKGEYEILDPVFVLIAEELGKETTTYDADEVLHITEVDYDKEFCVNYDGDTGIPWIDYKDEQNWVKIPRPVPIENH